MRLFTTLIVCASAALAQDTEKVNAAKGAIVGVQAQRMFEMRGRQMPINTRQIGIVIGKGLILTASLGGEPQNIRVFRPGTTEAVDAEVIDSDDSYTLLSVEGDDQWSPIDFDKDWKPVAGQKLVWVGMLGGNAGKWTPVTAESRVDAIIKDEASTTPIVYSDPPFRGPVLTGLILNGAGAAVGLMTMRTARQDNDPHRRFAPRAGAQGIPVVTPAAAFAQYLSGEAKKRGVLGVSVEALAPKVAEAMGLKGKRGVIVTEVTPGSAAEEAGLQAQDILTAVAGLEVGDPAGLQKALRGKGPGTEVEITLLRMSDTGPVEKTVKAELTAREESGKADRFRAARFGFVAEPLTAAHRRTHQMAADVNGVHVRRVTQGSPASMGRPSGLRRGDVILKVGEDEVKDIETLKAALKNAAAGKPVSIFVRNGKDTRFVEITPE